MKYGSLIYNKIKHYLFILFILSEKSEMFENWKCIFVFWVCFVLSLYTISDAIQFDDSTQSNASIQYNDSTYFNDSLQFDDSAQRALRRWRRRFEHAALQARRIEIVELKWFVELSLLVTYTFTKYTKCIQCTKYTKYELWKFDT